MGASHERLQEAVEEYEGRVQSLVEDLEVTGSNYQSACEEIAELKEQLDAAGSLQDQYQFLEQEVGDGGVVCKWVGLI